MSSKRKFKLEIVNIVLYNLFIQYFYIKQYFPTIFLSCLQMFKEPSG